MEIDRRSSLVGNQVELEMVHLIELAFAWAPGVLV